MRGWGILQSNTIETGYIIISPSPVPRYRPSYGRCRSCRDRCQAAPAAGRTGSVAIGARVVFGDDDFLAARRPIEPNDAASSVAFTYTNLPLNPAGD